jgi:hypothetical protein
MLLNEMLGEGVKITQVVDQSEGASASTDIDGDSVDMKGFEGVMFIAVMGPITAGAVTSIKGQQSSDDGVADGFSDLAGTQITIADDDDEQVFVLDIWRPEKRYVKAYIDRLTQVATVQTVLALQYGAKERPVTQAVADLVTYEGHASPAEGTA